MPFWIEVEIAATSIPLQSPMNRQTIMKERKAFSFAQVMSRMSKRIPMARIIKDIIWKLVF